MAGGGEEVATAAAAAAAQQQQQPGQGGGKEVLDMLLEAEEAAEATVGVCVVCVGGWMEGVVGLCWVALYIYTHPHPITHTSGGGRHAAADAGLPAHVPALPGQGSWGCDGVDRFWRGGWAV